MHQKRALVRNLLRTDFQLTFQSGARSQKLAETIAILIRNNYPSPLINSELQKLEFEFRRIRNFLPPETENMGPGWYRADGQFYEPAPHAPRSQPLTTEHQPPRPTRTFTRTRGLTPVPPINPDLRTLHTSITIPEPDNIELTQAATKTRSPPTVHDLSIRITIPDCTNAPNPQPTFTPALATRSTSSEPLQSPTASPETPINFISPVNFTPVSTSNHRTPSNMRRQIFPSPSTIVDIDLGPTPALVQPPTPTLSSSFYFSSTKNQPKTPPLFTPI